jgi:hypothetical protein
MGKNTNNKNNKVADQGQAEKDKVSRDAKFRRKSVDAGNIPIQANRRDSLKDVRVEDVSSAQYKDLAEEFVIFLKTVSGNVSAEATEWCDDFLPANQPFAKGLLVALAENTSQTFKMAR